MKEKQVPDEAMSEQAKAVIDLFKSKDQQNGINGNTYRVERDSSGNEVVVKEKRDGEEVHQPVSQTN